MGLREAMHRVLSAPKAQHVWDLRAEMLEAGVPADARVWEVVVRFHDFLDELATSTTSREYSELASKLDVGAVGGVLLEQVLEEQDAENLALRLLTGMVSEGLMVLATRQHVKAWEGELAAVYRRAAWYLYGELWRWAQERKPDLPPAQRRVLLDRVMAPVHSPDADGFSKALLLGMLFQVLLLSYLPAKTSA